ncbi:hypothetical protein [Terrihalobacillus insolitus]|uniref:hypothetical protein n=1 Tax=Terrihalobacillus insolitus TaxID=2950438 RepID=UPI002341E9C7|nr:hypothetical protein [Terrihalobacillus insolitus]
MNGSGVVAAYYGHAVYPHGLLDVDHIINMFSPDIKVARKRFKTFNETINNNRFLKDDDGP